MSTGRPTNTGNQAQAPLTFDQLKSQFDTKYTQYLALARTVTIAASPTDQQIAQLRSLNREVFTLLERLVQASASSQTAEMKRVNDNLTTTLHRIERQYNDLAVKSDKAETLRRIREFEELKADSSVNIYMVLLLIFAVALLIVMVFSSYLTSTANATAATSPTTIPPLT
jgi:chromosome condensin MukBEF ATPase and DNA-binding subunit MukB